LVQPEAPPELNNRNPQKVIKELNKAAKKTKSARSANPEATPAGAAVILKRVGLRYRVRYSFVMFSSKQHH